MVTFGDVNSFLKEHADEELAEQIRCFLDDFRHGKCYLHPFDNGGDHEYYFTNQDTKLSLLFVAGYPAQHGTSHACICFVCFDGKSLDLIDGHTLLDHFLQYESRLLMAAKVNLNDVEVDVSTKLKQGKLWVAFLVCEDHEGETAMAAYSKCLTPLEGLRILHANLYKRFIKI